MLGKPKILGTSIFIFATSTLNAGFYAGAGIGSDSVDYKRSSHVLQQSSLLYPPTFDVIDQSHSSSTGVFGSLFAGFEGLNNKLYYAGEINGNLSSTSTSASNHEFIHGTNANTHIKMKNSIGLSVIPGYQFTPDTLFYGRLGWTNSRIKEITSDTSLANFSKRLNGFRYGVGIKRALSDRLAVRMDYSRINYNSITGNTLDVVSSTSKSSKLTPIQQLIEFSLVYTFA